MKCRICLADYYLGDEISPDEPCWCGEMCSRFNFHDYPAPRYLPLLIQFRLVSFLGWLMQQFIPKEFK